MAPSPGMVMAGQAANSTMTTPYDADAAKFGLTNIYIVNSVLSGLSVIGSLAMILPYVASPAWRTKIRHQLILGLGISDFCNALCLLVPSISLLGGHHFRQGDAACVANVFFYLVTVLASSVWALAIALATYCLLVLPMSPITSLFSRPWFLPLVMLSVWSFGTIISIIGISIYHTSVADTGGFCFYAGEGRLFGQLSIFIPRAIVFVATITLYVLLFIFFRRKDGYVVHSDPNASIHAGLERYFSRPLEDGDHPDHTRRVTGTTTIGLDLAADDGRYASKDLEQPTSQPATPTRDRIFSVEKLISDVRSRAGSPMRRWGPPPAQPGTTTSGTASDASTRKASKDSGATLVDSANDLRLLALNKSLERGKGGGVSPATEVKWGLTGNLAQRRLERNQEGQRDAPALKVTSTTPSTPAWVQGGWSEPTLLSPKRRERVGSIEVGEAASASSTGVTALSSRSASEETERAQLTTARTSFAEDFDKPAHRMIGDDEEDVEDDDEEEEAELTMEKDYAFPPRPGTIGRQARLASLEEIDTPPGSPEMGAGAGRPRPVLTAPVIPNDFLSPHGGPRPTSSLVLARDFSPQTPAERRRSSVAMQFAAAAAANESAFGERPRIRRKISSRPGTAGSEANVNIDEPSAFSGQDGRLAGMSAQEMNRKASMLMLLYPAAYLLLFSVSLARLIVEFVAKGPADPVLKGLSKWLIISSGWVDAIIFIFIEWSFRRSNRRAKR